MIRLAVKRVKPIPMKYLYLLSLFLLLAGCDPEPTGEVQQTNYQPVLMKRADLESSIALKDSRPIKNAGKIYRQGSLLFINEKYEGVHVIDNSDPADPKPIAFLNIPGNVDIAMKGNIIYADNAVDMVTLKYDNSTVQVLERNRNVFPEMTPPDFGWIPQEYMPENRPAETLIVKWVEK